MGWQVDNEKIHIYCKKNGLEFENKVERTKSLILFLKKNNEKFVLKKLLVSHTEDIDQKFNMEINSIFHANEIPNHFVRAPYIVDIFQEDHFYLTKLIQGTTLYSLFKSPLKNRHQIMNIHKKLFRWLHQFYEYFKSDGLSHNFHSIMKEGSYTKKINSVLGYSRIDTDIVSLFNEKNIPISKVHGDLTPWNIMLDNNNQLYIIDWGNSGLDYPAMDTTRYMMQILKQLYFSNAKRQLTELFWNSFNSLYGDSLKIFKFVLNFQYNYSLSILSKKSFIVNPNKAIINLFRRIPIYLSSKYLLWRIIHRPVI